MQIPTERPPREPILPPVLRADQPGGPWGGGGNGAGGSGSRGGGGSGGKGDGGSGGGPRNPWALPPRAPRQTALDEFLKRTRLGGGGGGGPVLPQAPNPRALWGIGAALIVGAWVVFTSFHPIGPQQRGVVTYFGAYGGTLDPGIRLTLPAPIAEVTKLDVQNIRTINLPDDGSAGGGDGGSGTGGVRPMLTRDGNLIDLAYSVRWNIANPQNYVFQIKDPPATVAAVAESAMREEVANVSLDEALGPGRNVIEARVGERMQRILDGYRSGVRIQGVAIKQADPPGVVNDAFKDVTAAQSDAATARNNAISYSQRRIAQAQGEAAAFDAYYNQYKLAPEVTRRRMYYETMEAVLAGADKTVVEPNGVAPYLPINRARRAPEPGDAPAAGSAAPAPAAGAGQ